MHRLVSRSFYSRAAKLTAAKPEAFSSSAASTVAESVAGKPGLRFRIATLIAALITAILAIVSVPAMAHHPLDGQAMLTFWHGFLSGIAHPVLGMDHLVFILTIGVSAAFARSKVLVAACVIVGVLAGVALTMTGISIPAVETLIAVSLIVLGAMVFAATFVNRSVSGRVPSFDVLLVAAVSLFSVLHGSVYALVLVQQQSLPMAVLAGFVIALPVIYIGLLFLGRAATVGYQRFAYTALGPFRVMSLLSVGLGVSLLGG